VHWSATHCIVDARSVAHSHGTSTAEVRAVSHPVSLAPVVRGLNFSRGCIALSLARTDADAVRIASQRWGAQSAAAEFVRSAVAVVGGNADQGAAAIVTAPAAAEFFGAVQQQAIVGRLTGSVALPFNVRTLTITAGATAYWVAANSPKPVSRMSLAGEILAVLKTAAMVVLTKEAVENSSPATEARVNQDLQRACVALLDSTFIDPASTGVANESPASITAAATPTASSGNPGEDIRALVATFGGDFGSAFFISDPTTAVEISMARDASGSFMFPDCGPRGGSILGIPLLVSRSSPRDSSGGILVLLDASAVGIALEGARVSRSEQATLSMNDEPTDPPNAAVEFISLWQADLVAFLVEISANWKLARPDAVAVVTRATYSTAQS
jgi:HK97 family phage major capsid protein